MKTLAMMFGSNGLGSPRLMAEALRRMGRRGDTVLAHITPEEADMLMQAGGAGSINPDTGLPEFARRSSDDYFDNYTPRRTSQPAGATFEAPDFELDTNYTPRRTSGPVEVPVDVGFESRPLETTVRADVPQQRLYPSVSMAPDIRNNEPTYFPRGQRPATDFMGPLVPVEDMSSSYYSLSPRGDQVSSYLRGFEPITDQTVQPKERSLAQRAESGLQELRDVLDRYPNLTRAGTAGANILAQTLLFNQANREMQRGVEEARRAAVPFREAQAEAMGRATGEGLTPEQQQELETEQARARQGLTERNLQTGSAASGILAAQARRARSIARKSSFDEALRLANIADQYDRRALELELQRDQQLAQLFAGILGREVQQAQRTQAPVPETGR
jgi:hypothetical protein